MAIYKAISYELVTYSINIYQAPSMNQVQQGTGNTIVSRQTWWSPTLVPRGKTDENNKNTNTQINNKN